MPESLKVVGIDPGTRFTGYGVITRRGSSLIHIVSGVIRPGDREPLERRLLHIRRELKGIFETTGPDAVAVESVFYGKNVRSAVTLAHARGVILATAAECGLEVAEYSPLEVKKAVVGYGRAEKEQVQRMILKLFHLPEPDGKTMLDATDAMAVALCHLHTAGTRDRIRETEAALSGRSAP